MSPAVAVPRLPSAGRYPRPWSAAGRLTRDGATTAEQRGIAVRCGILLLVLALAGCGQAGDDSAVREPATGQPDSLGLTSPPASMDCADLAFEFEGLSQNVRSDNDSFSSSGVFTSDRITFQEPVRTKGTPLYFQFVPGGWMQAARRLVASGGHSGNPNDVETGIIVAHLKDQNSAEQVWMTLTGTIRQPVARCRQTRDGAAGYCSFAGSNRAVCFWIKDQWFTYIDVAVGAADGDMARAETMRDRIRDQVLAQYRALVRP